MNVSSPKSEYTNIDLDRTHLHRDIISEENEANRILAVCHHFSFRDIEEMSCLYLGNESDILINILARNFKKLYTLKSDGAPSGSLAHSIRGENIGLFEMTDGSLGVDDLSVDVVICDRFYSRVDNPPELMSEIYRCLKYDGFCYFSAYNKLSIIEGHYSIPFLSWLPRKLASLILRKVGYAERYSMKPLSLKNLKRLTDNFWRHDYIGLIRQNPQVFRIDETSDSGGFRIKAPGRLFKYIYPFLPLWIWILTKKK